MSTRLGSRTSAGRGFTLTEVLVAAGLSLLLLGLVIQFLVPAWRHYQVTSALAHLEQQAAVAGEIVLDDLQRTTRSGLRLLSGAPTVLALTPLSGVTGDGQLVWAEEMVLYSWHLGELRRMSLSGADGVTFPRDGPGQVTDIRLRELAVESRGRLMSQDVSNFMLTFTPEGLCLFSLTLNQLEPHPVETEWSRQVLLRNHQ